MSVKFTFSRTKGGSCPKDRSPIAGQTARSPTAPSRSPPTGTDRKTRPSPLRPPRQRTPTPRRGRRPDELDDAPPEEPAQGLYICLPAEQGDLAGFTDGTAEQPIAPGPLLAEVVTAVTGGDRAGLAQVSEDCLFSVLSAGRRMSSWGTWLELAAMHELAVRHPAVPAAVPQVGPAAPPGSSRAQKPVPAAGRRRARSGRRRTGPGRGGTAVLRPPGKEPADDGRIQFERVRR